MRFVVIVDCEPITNDGTVLSSPRSSNAVPFWWVSVLCVCHIHSNSVFLLLTLNNNARIPIVEIIFGCCMLVGLVLLVAVIIVVATFRLNVNACGESKSLGKKGKQKQNNNIQCTKLDGTDLAVLEYCVDAIVIIFVCLLRDERIHMVHVMCAVWLSLVGKIENVRAPQPSRFPLGTVYESDFTDRFKLKQTSFLYVRCGGFKKKSVSF